MKLYLMLGLPGETSADIDECASFRVGALQGAARRARRRAVLREAQDAARRRPFAGIDVVEDRIARLRSGLKGRADLRSPSARWAWVEYALSQGDEVEGLAVLRATRAGGRFADFRRELLELGYSTRGATGPRVRVAGAAPRGQSATRFPSFPLHRSKAAEFSRKNRAAHEL